MSDTVGAHKDLHSEQGARPGEHPGRSRNPVIKVHDIAWLEFEKPDLVRAEAFALAFGFSTVSRTPDELHLRGTDAGAPCVILRRGPRSRFGGAAFKARDEADVLRLAEAMGARTRALPEPLGGVAVDLVDPSGISVHVVAGTHDLAMLPSQSVHTFNFGHELRRVNGTQRPPRVPTKVQRLGHLVLQTTKYIEALDVLGGLWREVPEPLHLGWHARGPLCPVHPAQLVTEIEGVDRLRQAASRRSGASSRHDMDGNAARSTRSTATPPERFG